MVEESLFIQLAREAIIQLRRLAKDFPHLASPHVQKALETWNEEMFRKGQIIWLEQERRRLERSALVERAQQLLESHHVDEALELLVQEFDKELDYYALIDLGGREKYVAALRREAFELRQNFISPEQTAELWNNLGKPAVGGQHWNANEVSVLMG